MPAWINSATTPAIAGDQVARMKRECDPLISPKIAAVASSQTTWAAITHEVIRKVMARKVRRLAEGKSRRDSGLEGAFIDSLSKRHQT